jgi:hypothetical protein
MLGSKGYGLSHPSQGQPGFECHLTRVFAYFGKSLVSVLSAL